MKIAINKKGIVLRGSPREISDYFRKLADEYGESATLRVALEKENDKSKQNPSTGKNSG